MTVTQQLFSAYLECPTKCWLKQNGEKPTGNLYSEWLAEQNELYRDQETKRLMATVLASEYVYQPGRVPCRQSVMVTITNRVLS
jgi:hypothetical protein